MAQQDTIWVFAVGENIGQYKVIEQLGHGTYGQVYKVKWHSPKGEKIAALKILVQQIKNPSGEIIKVEPYSDPESLLQEVGNWAKVCSHENILKYISSKYQCEAKNKKYSIILSEFTPNGSLQDWLRRNGGKAPSNEDAVRMICGVLRGLECAHDNLVVHRDLKPSNVMLKESTPLIADFGTARNFNLEQSNLPGGTYLFIPPEAFDRDGKIKTVVERTEHLDLWSVSVMLHQMLTGKMLNGFNATMKDVPRKLRPFLTKALQHDPSKRYQSAREMREALEKIYPQKKAKMFVVNYK